MQHPPITRFPLSLSYLNSISAPSLPAQLGPKTGIRTRPPPFLPALLYRSSISPLRPKSVSYPPWVMKSPPNSTLKHLRRASSVVRGSPPASDPDISLPILPAPGWILFFSPKKGGEEGKNPNPKETLALRHLPDVPSLPPVQPSPARRILVSSLFFQTPRVRLFSFIPLSSLISPPLFSPPRHTRFRQEFILRTFADFVYVAQVPVPKSHCLPL